MGTVELLRYSEFITLKAGFNVKLKSVSVSLAVALIPVAIFWGCNKGSQPLSPANGSSLIIKLASNPSAQIVGAAQNLILYNISGAGASLTGSYGPVSASALAGQISIAVDIPNGVSNYNLLSVEIVDNSTQQALAIGASALPGTGSVTLGPLDKSFYQVSNLSAGDAFGFENYTITFVGVNTPTTIPGLDVVCNGVGGTGYALENPSFANSTVAYMGNGNFVNYLTVPPNSRFSNSSSTSKAAVLGGNAQPVTVGDVYCVKILTGGYAWLQITNAGAPGVSGPGFVFRLNTTQNYCGYEQSKVDGTPYAPSLVFNGIAANSYGKAVYPSNGTATSIFVSDATEPGGLTTTANVHVFNASATPVATFGPLAPLSSANGLAVNAAGTTIYVADPIGKKVSMFTMGTWAFGGSVGFGAGTLPDTPSQASQARFFSPEFVAASPSSGTYPNDIYITDSGTAGIADVVVANYPTTSSGPATTFWNGQIGTSTSSTGIATDGTTVYVADAGKNQIETYDANGVSGSTWTTDNNPFNPKAFSGPQGIALDTVSSPQLLFIADTGNNRVVEMTTSGVFKAAWGPSLGGSITPSTFNNLTAIAVDGATPPNVFVVDSNNYRVLQFKGF